jgi:hypothetical protein
VKLLIAINLIFANFTLYSYTLYAKAGELTLHLTPFKSVLKVDSGTTSVLSFTLTNSGKKSLTNFKFRHRNYKTYSRLASSLQPDSSVVIYILRNNCNVGRFEDTIHLLNSESEKLDSYVIVTGNVGNHNTNKDGCEEKNLPLPSKNYPWPGVMGLPPANGFGFWYNGIDKQLFAKGEFRKGVLYAGTQYIYDKNGILCRTLKVNNGKVVRESRENHQVQKKIVSDTVILDSSVVGKCRFPKRFYYVDFVNEQADSIVLLYSGGGDPCFIDVPKNRILTREKFTIKISCPCEEFIGSTFPFQRKRKWVLDVYPKSRYMQYELYLVETFVETSP